MNSIRLSELIRALQAELARLNRLGVDDVTLTFDGGSAVELAVDVIEHSDGILLLRADLEPESGLRKYPAYYLQINLTQPRIPPSTDTDKAGDALTDETGDGDTEDDDVSERDEAGSDRDETGAYETVESSFDCDAEVDAFEPGGGDIPDW